MCDSFVSYRKLNFFPHRILAGAKLPIVVVCKCSLLLKLQYEELKYTLHQKKSCNEVRKSCFFQAFGLLERIAF